MRETPNLLLKLPESTDYVNIEDINENMVKIDEEIAKINDPETGFEAKFTTYLAEKNPHSETETRSITVGVGKEFATIQSAINSVKKNLGGRVVSIIIDSGTYRESLVIQGFSQGNLVLKTNSGNRDVAILGSTVISDCTATQLHTLEFSAPVEQSINALSIHRSSYVLISKCGINANDNGRNKVMGVYVGASYVHLQQSEISNTSTAIHSDIGSCVTVNEVSGANNNVAFSAHSTSTIGKVNNTITGITQEVTYSGGMIR